MAYSITTSFWGGEVIICFDGVTIPADPANTDYQRYLEWVAEGNTPEPWQPDSES